jgi:hypothetical protein
LIRDLLRSKDTAAQAIREVILDHILRRYSLFFKEMEATSAEFSTPS